MFCELAALPAARPPPTHPSLQATEQRKTSELLSETVKGLNFSSSICQSRDHG